MGLETGSYVNDLVAANPVGSDLRSEGDDHIRLIKTALKNALSDNGFTVTVAKSLTTLGDFTATSGVFTGAPSFAYFGPSGAGTIALRPNGTGITLGQTTIDSTGTMTINGSISSTGSVTGSQSFISSGATVVLAATGSGAVSLRPNGNAAGETTISSFGNMSVGASITAVYDIISTNGYFKGAASSIYLSPSSTGTIYLRPNGSGSATGSVVITATQVTSNSPIVLPADPTADYQAATKLYVDTATNAPVDANTYVRAGSNWLSGQIRATYGLQIITDAAATSKASYFNSDGSFQPNSSVRGADASLQYPAYAFNSDWNSGIRRAAFQDFRFSVNQVEIQKWDGNGSTLYGKVRLPSTAEMLAINDDLAPLQIGATSTVNMTIDKYQIQSRTNGVGSTLWLQYYGGDMVACYGGGLLRVGGGTVASAGLAVFSTLSGELAGLYSTSTNTSSGPTLSLYRRKPAQAANDYGGTIRWYGYTATTNTDTEYAYIQTQFADTTAASPNAQMLFSTVVDGTLAPRMRIANTGDVAIVGNASVGPTTYSTSAVATGIMLSSNGSLYSKRAGTAVAAGLFLYNNADVAPTLVGSVATSAGYTILSNEAAGTGILLRPTNNGSTTGQVELTPAGDMNVAGAFNANASSTVGGTDTSVTTVALGTIIGNTGSVISKKTGTTGQGQFYCYNDCASAPKLIGVLGSGGLNTYLTNEISGGEIRFRPVGVASATGEVIIGVTGNITTPGSVTAAANFIASTTGLILATTGAGTINIRPNGAASATGAIALTTTTLGFFGTTPAARQAYVVPTGTISRATYATSTVTLPVLAGVVMALVTDLKALGLLG